MTTKAVMSDVRQVEEAMLVAYHKLAEARRMRIRLERVWEPERLEWRKGGPPPETWSTGLKRRAWVEAGMGPNTLRYWRELARQWGIDDSTVRRDARLGEAILAAVPTLSPGEREALEEATDAHLRVIADSGVPNKVEAIRELARWLPEAGNRSARVFAAHLRRLGLKGGASTYVYRCPQCGWQGRLRDFREEDKDA